MWKVLAAATLGGLVAAFTALSAQRWKFHLVPDGMTYTELAATLLAASALILAALGFFIAVLAVLGWAQFRGLVRKSATDTIKSHLQDGVLHSQFEASLRVFLDRQFQTGAFRKLIEERVDYVIYSGASGRVEQNADQNSGDENSED